MLTWNYMKYTLPKLPYSYEVLEPYIDRETMMIHHDKHHQAYVDKLNLALEANKESENKKLEEILMDLKSVPENIRMAVRNSGGGHWNHSFFWEVMAPEKSEPKGELLEAINKNFGDFLKFKEKFTQVAVNRFGSGWAWLVLTKDKKLAIGSTANQDNPLMTGIAEIEGAPILTLDVWEHAYYLKYQNRRPEYIQAWWNVVNWQKAEENYQMALKFYLS